MTRYLISFTDGAMDHIPDEDMPACAALATAGMSSSGMWSIAPSVNEIRYRVIP